MKKIVSILVFLFTSTSAEYIFTSIGSAVTIPCNSSSTRVVKLTNIKAVTEEDLGVYKCGNKIFELIKESPPEFVEKLSKLSFVEAGKEVELKCSVLKYSNTTTISWWRGDGKVINDSNVDTTTVNNQINSTLLIKPSSISENASFVCKASYKGNYSITSETKLTVFKYGTLQLSASTIKADSIWIRLNGNGLFVGTDILIEMRATGSEDLIEKKIITKEASNERIVKFNDLDAYASYDFVAYQTAGEYKDTKQRNISYKTRQAAPTLVGDIRMMDITENSFVVMWDKPEKLNGKVTEFLVTYSFFKENHIESKNVTSKVNESPAKREILILSLYSFVEYNVSVQEKTIEYSKPKFVLVKTTTGKPHAPQNLDTVIMKATSVKVSWDAIPSYLQGGVLKSYTITATSDLNVTIKKEVISANKTSYTFSGLLPYNIYLIKVFGMTDDQFGDEKVLQITTEEAPPSAPRNFSAKPRSQDGRLQFVQLKWSSPLHENGKILSFHIKYKIHQSCDRNAFCRRRRDIENYKNITEVYPLTPDASLRAYAVSNLEAFTQYLFQVREKTRAGWGNYSHPVHCTTLEGNPSPPLNVINTDITDNSITFVWDRPSKPNGIISSYTVKLKSADGKQLYRETSRAITDDDDLLTMTIENLNSETSYQVVVRASTENGRLHGKDSIPMEFTTKRKSSGFPWHFVLIGCLVTVLLIALVIAIFLLISRRRAKYEEVQTHENLDLTVVNKSKVIPVNDLKNYCAQQHANSDHGFQQEFESVRIPVHTFTWEHSQMPYNRSKNRYSNIVAYDHSRVILNLVDNDPSSTYINANFISGYQHQKKYIATQGPLPETVLDFWRMIWEYNTPVIVMLTKLVEDNKIKCEQYWPEGKALQYKDIVVTVNSISEMTDYVVRVFTLHKINNPELGKREVRQFHYTAWPDHGVPSHPTSMLSFVRHVRSCMNNKKRDGPVVVHCSAGVGRTGTFIAIESSLRQIEHDQNVDVYGTVCRMRMQRNFMVQIEAQYTFIYDALLDSVICGNTEIPPTDLVAKVRFLTQVDHKSGKTHFHEEFKRLESGIASTESSFIDASHMENKQKNRLLNILPYDHNRVKLVPIAGCRQSDYVNASIVDGFQQRNAFIATQAPLENTVTDFWRMVQERNIHIIVMLTKLVEKGQEKCYLYWPQAGTVSYGNIYVELVNVYQEEEHIVLHELRLTNRETGKSWMVSHFMYLGWPDTGSPKSGTELINVIGCVQRAQKSIANTGPTLVHCSGGVGRTGVFIAVFNSIEKLKAKDVVDVFQTIRQLRLQRVAMVQTLDQYIFCYQALKDYLDSFDLYTNVEKC